MIDAILSHISKKISTVISKSVVFSISLDTSLIFYLKINSHLWYDM
jgi:hypothetical protein